MLRQSAGSEGATQSQNIVSRDEISSLIEAKVTETLKRTLPELIKNALVTPDAKGSPNNVPGEPLSKIVKVADDDASSASVAFSRTKKYYAPVQEVTISEEIIVS